MGISLSLYVNSYTLCVQLCAYVCVWQETLDFDLRLYFFANVEPDLASRPTWSPAGSLCVLSFLWPI